MRCDMTPPHLQRSAPAQLCNTQPTDGRQGLIQCKLLHLIQDPILCFQAEYSADVRALTLRMHDQTMHKIEGGEKKKGFSEK